MLWWLLLATITICIWLKIYDYQRYWQKLNVPHLKPIPFLGNLAAFVFRRKPITDWLVDIYNSRRGRYFGIYVFLQPTLIIKDLDLIRQIGIKDFDHFLDHRTFVSENADPLFGKNLFSMRGSGFALLEGKTVMVHILSKFSFVIVKKSQVPLKINKSQFNLNVEKGFWLGLERRT